MGNQGPGLHQPQQLSYAAVAGFQPPQQAPPPAGPGLPYPPIRPPVLPPPPQQAGAVGGQLDTGNDAVNEFNVQFSRLSGNYSAVPKNLFGPLAAVGNNLPIHASINQGDATGTEDTLVMPERSLLGSSHQQYEPQSRRNESGTETEISDMELTTTSPPREDVLNRIVQGQHHNRNVEQEVQDICEVANHAQAAMRSTMARLDNKAYRKQPWRQQRGRGNPNPNRGGGGPITSRQ